MQIVIAWTEETQELVKAGRVDLGEANKFRTVRVPKACIWLNKGTERDLAKARTYAISEGHTVLCYENERDPLAQAKVDILHHGACTFGGCTLPMAHLGPHNGRIIG